MHPTVTAIFEEHTNPTYCSKQDVHDMAAPLLAQVTELQQQVAHFRKLFLAAELAPHDHALDGKFEIGHSKLAVLDTEMGVFINAGRRIAKAITQLDRELTGMKQDIQNYEAAKAS